MQKKKKYIAHHTRKRIIEALEQDLEITCKEETVFTGTEKNEREYFVENSVYTFKLDKKKVFLTMALYCLDVETEVVFGEINLDVLSENPKETHFKIMKVILNKIEYDGFFEVISRDFSKMLENYSGTSTMGGLYVYEWTFMGDENLRISFGGTIK